MASRKNLKKKINRFIIENVIDECIYLEEKNPNLENVCDELIDESVDFYNEMMSRMNASKTKSEFRDLINEFESKAEYFIDKLNDLNEKK